MSNKRHSTMPLLDRGGPKPPVHFSSSLVIPKHSILQGTHSITLQSETVLHPYCRLESNLGSILVGRRCVIQERAHVGAPPEDANAKPGAVVLGDYVLVEANCVIEAGDTEVGTGSVVQMGSRIGSGAKIGQNCTISPLTVIAPGEILADSTTVYSNGLRRIDKSNFDQGRKHQLVQQIAVARKLIRSDPERFQ